MRFRLIVLALGTFAIGTGSFVFAGPLEGVARDLSVSVGAAGNLVTVFAITYAASSPTRLMAVILIMLTLALLGFSVLVLWGAAGFALNPLQQYRVVQLAPCTRNVALSLNASAIYLGQGAGALRLAGNPGMDRLHLHPDGARRAPPHQQGKRPDVAPEG